MKIRLDISADTPTYYVNHVEIGYGSHDFSFAVARLPSVFSPSQLATMKSTGEITVTPELVLVLPPTLIPRLITALSLQQQKFESSFGKIKKAEDEK